MSKPSVDNYYAGGFKLYAADWSGATPPTLPDDWYALGNAPGFSTNVEFEELIHESSQEALLTEDASKFTKKTISIKMTLDEFDIDNVVMAFAATKTDSYTADIDSDGPINRAIKMVSQADSGPVWTIQLWKVSVKPTGDLDWGKISEYAQIEFEGRVLSDVANHATNRFGQATLAS